MSEAPGRRQAVRISDVARAAGVSKTLVSYALNDRPGVKESTRAHIVATAGRMGWVPSVRARALSASRAYAIGLVFRLDADAEYFAGVMAGLRSVLSAKHYALVTEVVESPEEEAEAGRRLLNSGRVDGLVTAADLAVDETRAVADVVAHLAGLGHTRIAQAGGPQRRELYQKFLREHDLDDSLWTDGDDGRAATAALLDTGERPTAIVYATDAMAIAGLSVLHERGLRVPDDVSIVGWGDLSVSRHLRPALSTVARCPVEEGRAAARRLLTEDTSGPPEPRFLPRASTGPVAPGRA